ncbi:phosphoenolpyruvate carboxylase [Candidatus Bathyarchaeota archaeon]|nr:phosphoenolpyruvate carboxylase [Candidatus Bathyarchaeota archaeon]
MKIPAAMATQHPDSATRCIRVNEEVDEALNCLRRSDDGLRCGEYLVDYMGKLTPYHQIGQIIRAMGKEDNEIPGKDVFITPRMVSSFREEPFRQIMTLSAVMEGMYESAQIFGEPGVREMILAMTAVNELKETRERARSIIKMLQRDLKFAEGSDIQVIPLFEGVPLLLSLGEILPKFNKELGGHRLFLGKSETSLVYGHAASSLAFKIALADIGKIGETMSTPYYPIFGGGCLPFRGHLTLENIGNILAEYKGVCTYTIQSGMRYDHGPEKTRELVEKIRTWIKQEDFLEFNGEDRDMIVKSIVIFAKNYLEDLLEIVDKVVEVAALVPNQRERLLESTDVVYYQSVRNIHAFLPFCPSSEARSQFSRLDCKKLLKLPRSIRFTAALYTVGLPPEFIGTGSALKEIGETLGQAWLDRLLDDIFPSLRGDLVFASRFLRVDSSGDPFMTDRILAGLRKLKEFVDFKEPDNSYSSLSKLAISCLRDFWSGKNTMPERFAILLSDGSVSEYVNNSIKDNLSKLILDMGMMRGSLG